MPQRRVPTNLVTYSPVVARRKIFQVSPLANIKFNHIHTRKTKIYGSKYIFEEAPDQRKDPTFLKILPRVPVRNVAFCFDFTADWD